MYKFKIDTDINNFIEMRTQKKKYKVNYTEDSRGKRNIEIILRDGKRSKKEANTGLEEKNKNLQEFNECFLSIHIILSCHYIFYISYMNYCT